MKRIVLCFDGTWNTPADDALPANKKVETNVSRFHKSVQPTGADGVKQISWYDAGVGTETFNKVTGGAFGTFLDKHILDGYRQLAEQYKEGDEIYIVGFSRGAYTARSLVGMLRNCGLVDAKNAAVTAPMAYGIYRTRGDSVDSRTAKAFRLMFSREVRIRFLGVWDTVGSLGIPLRMAAKFNAEFYRFHDTELSSLVENAFQAVALDEHREDYDICLWDPKEKSQQVLEQRWFCGAHSDVGGGYPFRKLSDLALRWMQDNAATLGLGLDRVKVGDDNFRGVPTDSYAAFLGGEYARLKPRHLRPTLGTSFGNERLDASIASRRGAADLDPRYAPTNIGLPPL